MTKRRLLSEKERESDDEPTTERPGLAERFAPAVAYCGKHKKAFLAGFTVLLILIPLFLAFYIRTFPASLPVANDWAQNNVYNGVKSNIADQVRKQYPNLPQQNIQQIVDQQFTQVMKDPTASGQVQQQVQQAAAFFRSRLQDDTGQTYLLAIDPYQWLRYVHDVLDHGYAGDTVRNGTDWDNHMYAPIGAPVAPNFHVWLAALIYRVLRALGSGVSVMGAMFWMPAVLASLAVIPSFFIGFRKGGLLGGFFAATLVGVHAGFVGRTPAGFADTDAYVVLLPLLIMWFFLEAFETEAWNWKRRIAYLVLTGAAFGLLAWVWNWGFFFALFIYTLLAYLVYMLIRQLVAEPSVRALLFFFKGERFRWYLVMLGGFIVCSSAFLILRVDPRAILAAPLIPFTQATTFKAAVQAGSIWPNVFTTVAELNVPSLSGIVTSIGGKLLFFIALMGILFTLVSKKRLIPKDWILLGIGAVVTFFLLNRGTGLGIVEFLAIMALPVVIGGLLLLKDDRGIDIKYAIFLSTWLMASVFTMTQGVRFVLLLIPPFAIAAAIAVGSVYSLLKEYLTAHVGFSRLWVAPLLFLALCSLLVAPLAQGYAAGRNQAPSMDDGWWNSLTKIRQDSQPDAIINSWWDFGHWFKYVADRGVTFDGASQTSSNAHWIGRVLLTSDEKEALAILRMVDCGNYLATDEVRAALPGHDQYGAIMLTKRIIMMPRADAREALLDAGITQDAAEGILNHTHCDPPEDYFITSADMVGKGGVWGHFGDWDFAKSDAYEHFRNEPQSAAVPAMMAKYNWTEDQAGKVFYDMQALPSQDAVNAWISPWPGYPTSSFAGCTYGANGSVSCPLGYKVSQQQGTSAVLQSIELNGTGLENVSLRIAFVDSQGRKVGENDGLKPTKLILVTNSSFDVRDYPDGGFSQAFVVDLRGAPPQALMTAPENADSLFTRLFFLDGANTTAFRKFSDTTSVTTGRVIVWKVDWSKLQAFGLV